MSKVSVVIPSYNCKFVSKTVDDVFKNATGEIEVIVVLDGYKPDPPIKERKNLTIVYKEINLGMRSSINQGVCLASGEYVLKLDDHCTVSVGFDEILKKSSEVHQITIPARKSLDVVNWLPIREQSEYDYLAYPYVFHDRFRYGIGLFSKKWEGEHGNDPTNRGVEQYYWKEHHKKEIRIDEIMIFPGACWFMPRNHFFSICGLDEKLFKTLYQEPVEITMKTWLSGGRVVVNKDCWYSHMHKGRDFGDEPNIRGYRLDLHAMRETERFGTAIWMGDRWEGANRSIKWLINRFWPIPGWPSNWESEQRSWEKRFPIKLEEKYHIGTL